jgi:hypothetical protein
MIRPSVDSLPKNSRRKGLVRRGVLESCAGIGIRRSPLKAHIIELRFLECVCLLIWKSTAGVSFTRPTSEAHREGHAWRGCLCYSPKVAQPNRKSRAEKNKLKSFLYSMHSMFSCEAAKRAGEEGSSGPETATVEPGKGDCCCCRVAEPMYLNYSTTTMGDLRSLPLCCLWPWLNVAETLWKQQQ